MRAPFIWTKPAYPILAKLDRLPVPLRGSLLSLRWRETDSNLRFPAAKETNPLREAVTGATKVRLQAVAYLPGTDRRYGADGEDGNFVVDVIDGVPRCPSQTT